MASCAGAGGGLMNDLSDTNISKGEAQGLWRYSDLARNAKWRRSMMFWSLARLGFLSNLFGARTSAATAFSRSLSLCSIFYGCSYLAGAGHRLRAREAAPQRSHSPFEVNPQCRRKRGLRKCVGHGLNQRVFDVCPYAWFYDLGHPTCALCARPDQASYQLQGCWLVDNCHLIGPHTNFLSRCARDWPLDYPDVQARFSVTTLLKSPIIRNGRHLLFRFSKTQYLYLTKL